MIMDVISLYIMDISMTDNTSGVDRYIQMLINGLKQYKHIKLYWIRMLHSSNCILNNEEYANDYVKIEIPLPQYYDNIISEKFWINKYNEQVYRIIRHIFNNDTPKIIHLNTINLIDLALLIKSKVACKIITHLHCIPWKDLYNSNVLRFNRLYQLQQNAAFPREMRYSYLMSNSELQAYDNADHIICVTSCAKSFLQNIMHIKRDITVIPNGIDDCIPTTIVKHKSDCDNVFRMLYVGIVSRSKGIEYILKALQLVANRGYTVSLTVVGKITPAMTDYIKTYSKLFDINITGRVPFAQLKYYYQECDAGVIASLQEQCSYVALEMAMFRLPIVTTAIDGLDEMFTHGLTALKVDVTFDKFRGLIVDVKQMAEHIVTLIEHATLRENLGRNARLMFEKNYTTKIMTRRTVNIYHKLLTI